MKPVPHGIHAARGFTLIEVILALALTALLLGLLSTGMYMVAADWERDSDVLDRALDEALAVLQVDRALHGAFPHSYTDPDTLVRGVFFSGADDRLAWVSTVSPQRSPGLSAWQLDSVRDEGVYLTMAPAFSDHPGPRLELAQPLLLLPDYRAEFSYLYEEADGNKVWTESWEAEELLSLPLAVHIRFLPEDDAAGEPLEVVARIRNNEHRSIRPDQAEIRNL